MKNNFKEYRISKGWSQTEVAKLLDIPQSQISAVENYKAGISNNMIENIMRIDPTADLNYILGYSETASQTNDQTITKLKEEVAYWKDWAETLKEALKEKNKD